MPPKPPINLHEAAPDLYDALVAVLKWRNGDKPYDFTAIKENHERSWAMNMAWCRIQVQIKKALAKARGK